MSYRSTGRPRGDGVPPIALTAANASGRCLIGTSYWNCMPVRDLPGGAPGIQSTEFSFREGKMPSGRVRLSPFHLSLSSSTSSSRRGRLPLALLFVECAGKNRQAEVPWRLVVVPRPALDPLVEAMGKLVMAEGGEAIRKRAESGSSVLARTTET